MLIKRIIAVDKKGRPIEYGATYSGRKYHIPSGGGEAMNEHSLNELI